MKNQNLLNRLNSLEQNNKDLIQDRKLIKFLDSLPIEDQKKFTYPESGVIIYKGQKEDWERIIKPFGDTGKTVIIDNI